MLHINSNKIGYILGFSISLIYTFSETNVYDFTSFLARYIGVLIIPLLISLAVNYFSKSKNPGKIFAIISLVIFTLAYYGKHNYDLKENKVVVDSLDLIISEHKKSFSDFDKKLNYGNKKEILNQLIINNDIVLNENTNYVLERIEEAESYFKLMKNGNDSIIKKTIKKLDDYKKNKNIDTVKLSNIDMYIVRLNSLDSSIMLYYLNMSTLILEMKSLIKIKKNCKHSFKNSSILFYDQNCLNEYNKTLSNINYFASECNKLKTNLKKI